MPGLAACLLSTSGSNVGSIVPPRQHPARVAALARRVRLAWMVQIPVAMMMVLCFIPTTRSWIGFNSIIAIASYTILSFATAILLPYEEDVKRCRFCIGLCYMIGIVPACMMDYWEGISILATEPGCPDAAIYAVWARGIFEMALHATLIHQCLISHATMSMWALWRSAMIAVPIIYLACCFVIHVSCSNPVFPGVAGSFAEASVLSVSWAAVTAFMTPSRRVRLSELAGMHTLKVNLRNLTDDALLPVAPTAGRRSDEASLDSASSTAVSMLELQMLPRRAMGARVPSSCSLSELCEGAPLDVSCTSNRTLRSYPLLPQFFHEGNNGGDGQLYCSREERKRLQLRISHGVAVDEAASPLAPDKELEGLYVLTVDSTLLVHFAEETDGSGVAWRHSFLVAGEPVAAAGMITVFRGRIKSLSNESGHYRPPPSTLQVVLDHLASLHVDVQSIRLEIFRCEAYEQSIGSDETPRGRRCLDE